MFWNSSIPLLLIVRPNFSLSWFYVPYPYIFNLAFVFHVPFFFFFFFVVVVIVIVVVVVVVVAYVNAYINIEMY